MPSRWRSTSPPRVTPRAVVTRRGRRPGKRDTRTEILDAARAAFLDEGYDATTVRSVARRAAVDASLVHHYFGDKAALFLAVIDLGRDPRAVAAEVALADGPKGEALVAAFLDLWEGPGSSGEPGSAFVALVQAATSSAQVADALRGFLAERVWTPDVDADIPGASLQGALVSSQLFGIGWTRYVLRVEPVASATVAQVAAWFGPTIDRHRAV